MEYQSGLGISFLFGAISNVQVHSPPIPPSSSNKSCAIKQVLGKTKQKQCHGMNFIQIHQLCIKNPRRFSLPFWFFPSLTLVKVDL